MGMGRGRRIWTIGFGWGQYQPYNGASCPAVVVASEAPEPDRLSSADCSMAWEDTSMARELRECHHPRGLRQCPSICCCQGWGLEREWPRGEVSGCPWGTGGDLKIPHFTLRLSVQCFIMFHVLCNAQGQGQPSPWGNVTHCRRPWAASSYTGHATKHVVQLHGGKRTDFSVRAGTESA